MISKRRNIYEKKMRGGGDRGCRALYNYTYKNLLLLKNGINELSQKLN